MKLRIATILMVSCLVPALLLAQAEPAPEVTFKVHRAGKRLVHARRYGRVRWWQRGSVDR